MFLKDHESGSEIHRTVFKYVKTIVSFLSTQVLQVELCEQIVNGIFGIQNDKKTFNKHNTIIKKILSKLIKKMGLAYVKQITPENHHSLISYVERVKRKRLNKQKRERLLALLGQEETKEAKDAEMKSEDTDSSSASEQGYDEDDGEHGENYSLNSESESDDEEVKGGDTLMTDDIDIPRVDDIPVVSRIAKDKKTT